MAREKGYPVRRVYPDQAAGPNVLEASGEPIGTLLIPNSIMLLKDAPHPDNAKRFIDWVLRREIEQRLAESRSAQIPVRADVPRPDYVGKIGDFKVMTVDYAALGRSIGGRTEELSKTFLR